MCLSKVSESYEPPCTMITDGWKDLGGDPKTPRVGMAINGKYDVPLDRWVASTNEHAKAGVKADDGAIYEPGFHVYAEEPKYKGALRRVFVRNITCRGTDRGKETLIAREMFVPSGENVWPPKGNDPVAGSGGGSDTKLTPPSDAKGVKKLIDKMKGMGTTPGQA